MNLIKPLLFLILFLPRLAYSFLYEEFWYDFFSTVHVLIVDPNEHQIRPVRAAGDKISREFVSELVEKHGAEAGINGGFWKLDGTPAGILKINGKLCGVPSKPRGAIGWTEGGKKALIDQVLLDENQKILPACTPSEEWKKFESVVGGAPVLIHRGEIIEDFSSEQVVRNFLTGRYPRTAVDLRADGLWVFVVVCPHFYRFVGGVTIKELSQLLFELGCDEALNLDGASSSTMIVGKNVTAGAYKQVSDAILIFKK